MNDIVVFGCCGDISAGKTTVGRLMAPWGFALLNFADELKRIATESFGWDGKKDERGRRLLQIIGTECGRDYNSDMWVNKLKHKLANQYAEGQRKFVICDCRFENEMKWVLGLGGQMLWVRNLVAEAKNAENTKAFNHASEQEWRRLLTTGVIPYQELDNNGSISTTFGNITEMLSAKGIKLQ